VVVLPHMPLVEAIIPAGTDGEGTAAVLDVDVGVELLDGGATGELVLVRVVVVTGVEVDVEVGVGVGVGDDDDDVDGGSAGASPQRPNCAWQFTSPEQYS